MSLALEIPLEEVLSAMLPPDKVLKKEGSTFLNLFDILMGLGLEKKETEDIYEYIVFTLFKRSRKTTNPEEIINMGANSRKNIKKLFGLKEKKQK